MEHPFTAHFPEALGPTGREFRIPARQEVSIQLRLVHRLQHRQAALKFGCEGPMDSKPLPFAVRNTFVAEGARKEQSPATDPNHYIDTKGAYNIHEDRECAKGGTQALGFLVKTQKPGRFPVRLITTTDSGPGQPLYPLFLIVEDDAAETIQ